MQSDWNKKPNSVTSVSISYLCPHQVNSREGGTKISIQRIGPKSCWCCTLKVMVQISFVQIKVRLWITHSTGRFVVQICMHMYIIYTYILFFFFNQPQRSVILNIEFYFLLQTFSSSKMDTLNCQYCVCIIPQTSDMNIDKV